MVNARELRTQLEKITAEQETFRECELNPLRTQIAELTKRDLAYSQAISGIKQLLDTLPSEPEGDERGPSFSQAIVDLLRERGTAMTAQEIWEALNARGYTTKVNPPYNAVHFGVRDKLAPKGPLERVNPGTWRWVGDVWNEK